MKARRDQDEGAPTKKADEAQPQQLTEARAVLLERLGLTPARAESLGIELAQLDAIAAQGMSLEEAIAGGLLTIPPEVASELIGDSIRQLQQHAVAKGLNGMSNEEIEDEIEAARAVRPDQRR